MSEDQTTSEATSTEAAKPKKNPVVYTEVKFTNADGAERSVAFPGKTRMLKETWATEDGVGLRIDFVNGDTRSCFIPKTSTIYSDSAEHGLSQKVGDEASGDKVLTDAIEHIDAVMRRLEAGNWAAEGRGGAGDSFAGTHIVVQAIMEATGKSKEFVKKYLADKLEAGKEAGLTRQKLYNGFRKPDTKTGQIILRMEKEAAEKETATFDVDAEMEGLAAA